MDSDSAPAPSDSRSSRGSTLVLAATVFLSAWLLFQVQPMVAKRILPWFGGGPAIWTTTMLFFQTALLAGYFYAHLLASRLPPTRQFRVHLALLAGAAVLIVFNSVIPSEAWKPTESNHPAWDILLLLTATIGLPYVLLAATAPLVQAWYAGSDRAGSPYRLYALSNLGSLAALFTYPFVVEPHVGIVRQGVAWSALFGLFVLLCGASGWTLTRGRTEAISFANLGPEADDEAPSKLRRFLWIAFPASASVALLAITNYLAQDVASFPLIWIIPLAVYLITFIATFDSDRWYRRIVWMPLAAAATFGASYSWFEGSSMPLEQQLFYHVALLLSLGMVCHGEVARLRPNARRLTSFYLAIAAGGALGGVLTALVAPILFTERYELQLSIIAVWALAMIVLATDRRSPLFDGRIFPAWLGIAAMLITFLVISRNFYVFTSEHLVARVRNFYGVLKVSDFGVGTPDAYRKLTNGRISHGAQYLSPDNRRVPAQYYFAGTGVSQAIMSIPAGRPHRVGVVGLGAGVLASYADKGDYFAFYDINPLDIEVADKYFTFLKDARERGATVNIIQGDARLSLEKQPPQKFDVLVLDAFSGDAIPVHLLTREALDLAWSHVAEPDGVLAVHVSNLHLDLQPVVNAAAKRHKLEATFVDTYRGEDPASVSSDWILLTTDTVRFLGAKDASPLVKHMGGDRTVEWTDDYSNLLEIMK